MKKKLIKILIQLIVFLVALEVVLFTASSLKIIDIGRPSYQLSKKEHFWNDSDSIHGAWRKPNHEYTHMTQCFSVTYKSNSVGIRDQERSLNSSNRRVVLIGDSFAEGWGVKEKDRFSNQLEDRLGMEFLNFGTSNYGLTQEYLLYQARILEYDHDAVLWTFFPENDMLDDDIQYCDNLYLRQYRAFWKGKYPNYNLYYGPNDYGEQTAGLGQELGWKDIPLNFSYTSQLVKYLKVRYIHLSQTKRNPELGKSGYFKMSQAQWDRMRYTIERLKEVSGDRKVYIVTIPGKYDIARYKEGKESVPLRDSLEQASVKLGFEYYDLLREFDELKGISEKELYLDCDNHWNKKGHQWAARVMDSVFSFDESVILIR